MIQLRQIVIICTLWILNNIMLYILVGMCYSGKTTIGKLLGNRLMIPSVDFAELFKKKFNQTEMEYLGEHGKRFFKEAEAKIMSKDYDNMVLSLSGSAIYQEESMERLKEQKNTKVIFLDVPLEVVKQRRSMENKDRPILYPEGIDTFEDLYIHRRPLYSKYANIVVPITSKDTPQDVLDLIIEYLQF